MSGRPNQRGVTLTELLAAIAILALAASVAVLSAPPARGPAQQEAERFAARLAAAAQAAAISGAPHRLDLSPTAYGVMRYDGRAWKPADETASLAPRRIADTVRATIEIADAALANEPLDESAADEARRILFDPIGVVVPFTVDFADRNERWRVSFSAHGEIKVAPHGR